MAATDFILSEDGDSIAVERVPGTEDWRFIVGNNAAGTYRPIRLTPAQLRLFAKKLLAQLDPEEYEELAEHTHAELVEETS